MTFKDGKVVEHGAEKNASLLAELLSTDENACRIGEIAWFRASSPHRRIPDAGGLLQFEITTPEDLAVAEALSLGGSSSENWTWI